MSGCSLAYKKVIPAPFESRFCGRFRLKSKIALRQISGTAELDDR